MTNAVEYPNGTEFVNASFSQSSETAELNFAAAAAKTVISDINIELHNKSNDGFTSALESGTFIYSFFMTYELFRFF